MTQVFERERELQHEVEETVSASAPDVEVLAVELLGNERFCVYIDHPAGVDHALCERVTAVLRAYLDRYTVDVSSPGFRRPLRRQEHFERVRGRRVTARTGHEIAGRTRFKGEVGEVGESAVTLQTFEGAIEIPYEAIVRSNLIEEDG